MSITHCRLENDECRSVAMSGSATFTIVTSIRSMKVPSDTVMSGSHLRMPKSVGAAPRRVQRFAYVRRFIPGMAAITSETVTLDRLDRQLLHALQYDGRASFRVLSDLLGA